MSSGRTLRPGQGHSYPVAGAVVLTILCWSSNFPTIRFILREYDPLSMSVLRTVTGAAILAGWALATRMPLPRWKDWPLLALFGLVIAGATLTLNLGLRTIGAGAGSFLIGTVPVFSALLARAFLHEWLGWRAWLGIAVSFTGVGIIALGEGEGLRFNAGAIFLVTSALLQAFYYVFQKWLHGRYSPIQITCCSIWSAAMWMLAFLPRSWPVIAAAPLPNTLGVIYLGLFPTAIAFTAWNFALSRASAAKVTSSMYALPILAIAIAYAWLGEVPAPLSLLGGLTALSGVAMVHLWDRGAKKG